MQKFEKSKITKLTTKCINLTKNPVVKSLTLKSLHFEIVNPKISNFEIVNPKPENVKIVKFRKIKILTKKLKIKL